MYELVTHTTVNRDSRHDDHFQLRTGKDRTATTGNGIQFCRDVTDSQLGVARCDSARGVGGFNHCSALA